MNKEKMRILESHEILLVAGGFMSDNSDDWLNQYQNGYQYDENAIMGEAFGYAMMNANSTEAIEQLQYFDIHYAPANPDASLVAALTAGILGIIGIETGFDAATGLRVDGLPAGSGCGNVSTDWIVPDRIFGIDVAADCVKHDIDYRNQIGKDNADNIFRQSVYDSSVRQGAPEWAAGVLSWIYYEAVHNLGTNSYNAAGGH
jgi:hypothetical protein